MSDIESVSVSPQENYRGVWDNRVGFGKKAAVIVIDLIKAYTLPDAPLYAPGVAPAVRETADLLAVARKNGVRVIHTTVRYQPSDFADGGMWVKKAPVLRCLAQSPYDEVCEGVEPLDHEVVVVKQYASAFFGTSLAATLNADGIDTLIITGCTTSGCIRATAVDAVQNGFRAIVPRECVGDRHPGPHDANLFDIDSKYGDVVSKAETLAYLAQVVNR